MNNDVLKPNTNAVLRMKEAAAWDKEQREILKERWTKKDTSDAINYSQSLLKVIAVEEKTKQEIADLQAAKDWYRNHRQHMEYYAADFLKVGGKTV